MGNAPSNINFPENIAKKEFNNFYEIIDYIACNYILTMNYQSLLSLKDEKYCNDLVVLTADIIQQNFTNKDITYLAQRVKDGVTINALNTENLTYFVKSNMDNIDISKSFNKSVKKRRICVGIAKFYVKIAHVFSAILMTINPVYIYKNEVGEIKQINLKDKNKVSSQSQIKLKVKRYNICDNRINALKHKEIMDDTTKAVTTQPKICNMNLAKNSDVKSLTDEPGIKELMQLYLDDNYDYNTGLFTAMSPQTQTKYEEDLKLFYTAFTGNKNMPPEIKQFSDIKLKDYSKTPQCIGIDAKYKQKYTLKQTDELFIKYAEHINKMMQTAADNQYKLLSVINELFTHTTDPNTKKPVVRVNPELTDDKLQKVVEITRKLIIELYVKCEQDYATGIKIYDAIVESKFVEVTPKQINALKKCQCSATPTSVTKPPSSSPSPMLPTTNAFAPLLI